MNSSELQQAFGSPLSFHTDEKSLTGMVAVQRIPTGSLGLDIELGGGWPVGYTSEITGPPAVGTSTLALHGIAGAQKADPALTAMLYDLMGDFSPYYATACGIDLHRLVLSPLPLKLPRQSPALLVVDPLTDRWWNPSNESMTTTSLVVTQYRTTLSSVSTRSGGIFSGSNTVRTGSVDADVRVQLKVQHLVLGGIMVKATVDHDSFHPGALRAPAEFKIRYGRGIDYNDELLRLALDRDIVWREHGRYFYDTDSLGHGWKAAVRTLQLDYVRIPIEKELRALARI